LFALAIPSPGLAVDNQGPPCTDINGRDGSYLVVSGDAIFTFKFFTVATLCNFADYVLIVTDSQGGTITATYPASPGNEDLTLCTPPVPGQGCLAFSHNYGQAQNGTTILAPATVFVRGESRIGPHIADVAPNPPAVTSYGLCENPDDPTTPVPGCSGGDNAWDQ
jgi:hypothetical protein